MRRARRGGRVSRPLLLFTLFFLALALLAGQVAAQDDDDNAPAPTEDKDGDDEKPPPPETQPPPETDDAPTPTDEDNTDEPEKTDEPENTDEPEPTDEPKPTDEPTSEQTTEAPKTTESEPTTTDSETSTKTDSAESDTFTLPSLTNAPKIPTPTIPPTKGAPYLRESTVPEGTIFIAVGAAIGFFAFAVFAWRGLVAWSINRSVRNTPVNAPQSDATALLKPSKRKSRGTSMSMEKLGGANRHSLPPRSHPPNSSLFFSPTAGTSMNTPGNRGSGYLPAGYYAASSAAPGGGSGLGHVSNSSIGLSPLGPQAQGYSRTRSGGPSPPGSPGLPPSSRGYEQPHHQSTSSLNLTQPPQGRAPSAYLEDLFENHPPGR